MSYPMRSCDSPTSMSIGEWVKSTVSTTGTPESMSSARLARVWTTPVIRMPSGRRPMIARSNSSSRDSS